MKKIFCFISFTFLCLTGSAQFGNNAFGVEYNLPKDGSFGPWVKDKDYSAIEYRFRYTPFPIGNIHIDKQISENKYSKVLTFFDMEIRNNSDKEVSIFFMTRDTRANLEKDIKNDEAISDGSDGKFNKNIWNVSIPKDIYYSTEYNKIIKQVGGDNINWIIKPKVSNELKETNVSESNNEGKSRFGWGDFTSMVYSPNGKVNKFFVQITRLYDYSTEPGNALALLTDRGEQSIMCRYSIREQRLKTGVQSKYYRNKFCEAKQKLSGSSSFKNSSDNFSNNTSNSTMPNADAQGENAQKITDAITPLAESIGSLFADRLIQNELKKQEREKEKEQEEKTKAEQEAKKTQFFRDKKSYFAAIILDSLNEDYANDIDYLVNNFEKAGLRYSNISYFTIFNNSLPNKFIGLNFLKDADTISIIVIHLFNIEEPYLEYKRDIQINNPTNKKGINLKNLEKDIEAAFEDDNGFVIEHAKKTEIKISWHVDPQYLNHKIKKNTNSTYTGFLNELKRYPIK